MAARGANIALPWRLVYMLAYLALLERGGSMSSSLRRAGSPIGIEPGVREFARVPRPQVLLIVSASCMVHTRVSISGSEPYEVYDFSTD